MKKHFLYKWVWNLSLSRFVQKHWIILERNTWMPIWMSGSFPQPICSKTLNHSGWLSLWISRWIFYSTKSFKNTDSFRNDTTVLLGDVCVAVDFSSASLGVILLNINFSFIELLNWYIKAMSHSQSARSCWSECQHGCDDSFFPFLGEVFLVYEE